MQTPRTTTERLELLLEWLNNDEGSWVNDDRPGDSLFVVRHRLTQFIKSFDGSESAGYVRATIEADNGEEWPTWLPKPDEPWAFADEEDELFTLHGYLVDVLKRGFPKDKEYAPAVFDDVMSLPLAFGIERSEARRGTYVLHVSGRRFHLVQFLVLHALTRGSVTLGRCPAPAPYSSTERCGHFFVVTEGERGRPRTFCRGEACKNRNHRRSLPEGAQQRRK